MLSGLCPAHFGVLFCRLVLGCRYTPKTLDACFLTGGVFEYNIAYHHQSVAVLCMLYKRRVNPMQTLHGAPPVPYVPVPVIRGSLVALRYTYAPPCCRTSQSSVSLWNDLVDPVFDDVGHAGFKNKAIFFIVLSWYIAFVFYCFSISRLSFCGLVLCEQGSSD